MSSDQEEESKAGKAGMNRRKNKIVKAIPKVLSELAFLENNGPHSEDE